MTRFRCEECGRTFLTDDDREDEMWEEFERENPGIPRSDSLIVCDDCYNSRKTKGRDTGKE